jgi:hypothetical protein
MTIGDSLGPDGRRPEFYGVRGWLLFLCIIMMVILPLQMVLIAIAAFGASEPSVLGGGFLTLLFAVNGVGFVAGVLLYRENPLGLRLAKIWFAFRILLTGGIALLNPAATLTEFPIEALFSVAIPSAWLIYLYRSERVWNTYSRVHAESAAEVFK